MNEPRGHSLALDAGGTPLGHPARADDAPGRAPSLAANLRHAIYGSPVYRLTLAGRAPSALALAPPDPWPGDAARADALFQGRYRFAGHEIRAPARPPWAAAQAPEAWIEELHAFEWLRDLKANGGETARRHARALIADWRLAFDHWQPVIWRADVLGRRLAAWLANAAFLLDGADDRFAKGFYRSLGRQARHLGRTAAGEVAGARRLSAIRGLIYAILCHGLGQRNLAQALRLLERELAAQLLSDGGHIERSPRLLCRVLGDFADLKRLLEAANQPPPALLVHSLDRIGPMLRALRHGDGGLACFNNSGEGRAELIDAILTISDTKSKPLANAPHAGFQRMAAKRTLLLADCGPPSPLAGEIHAGTLSFEMSVGKTRMVVNSGPHRGRDPDWAAALRSTAAHSTVTVCDTNSTEFRDAGLGRRPRAVHCARHEQDGAIWLETNHDGYAPCFGLVHRRRLYLDGEGGDLRGEDRLEPVGGARADDWRPRPFALRFHLHPSVSASLAQNGEAVLLRLADGSGWQFRAAGGALGLHGSVYFGAEAAQRRSEQIVVSATTRPEGGRVKWAFRRVSSP